MRCFRSLLENKNKVHPSPVNDNEQNQKVNAEYLDRLSREIIPCGYCNRRFNLGSNELKIHCNICNKFYHCGIAGHCIGIDCKVHDEQGKEYHSASYCINCVSKIYKNNECLGKDCAS